MAERPILFSAPMVRAILAGTKTQTRRAVKMHRADGGIVYVGQDGGGWWPYRSEDGESFVMSDGCEYRYACPYGQPGDRLWVRETWMDVSGTGVEARDPHTHERTRYAYGADTPAGSYADQCRKDYGLKWRPSIHMPRAASRITLEVTGVRVERLQDISREDAAAEGWNPAVDVCSPLIWYAALWESINGPGSWALNPWVWVISFHRVEKKHGSS